MPAIKNYLTIGNKFSGSPRRKPLTKLLDAVGTDDAGKLNSTADLAGTVNSYIAALPQSGRILSDAEAAVAAGKLPRGALSTLKRGFGAAEHTVKSHDDIVNYLDSVLPKRVKQLDSSGYTPPEGYFNLKALAAPPSEIIGTPQQAMHLSVPGTFNIDEFASRMTPERVKSMQKAAYAGAPIGGQYWYNMAPIYEKFVQMFGPEEGRARFTQWARDNAALSPRSSVADQTVRESQINYFLDKEGRLPTNADMKARPDMYGHLAHDAHLGNFGEAELIKTGSKPKIGSYYQNYLGNMAPGTMDVHHFTAAGLSNPIDVPLKVKDPVTDKWVPKRDETGEVITNRSWAPDDRFYTPLELATDHLATRMGVAPAEYQATVWNGLAQQPGLLMAGKKHAPRTTSPYAVIFDQVLRDSATARGKSPDDMFFDAMTRQDYLTRPAGVAKKRTLKEAADLEDIDQYAAGGLVKKAIKSAAQYLEGRGYEEAPRGGLSVVKQRGGDWSSDSVEGPMRGRKVPSNLEYGPELNNWIDKQLTRYVKNDMATPEDPIRALAEQGVLHYRPTYANVRQANLDSRNFGRSQFPQEPRGSAALARTWDDVADSQVTTRPAGALLRGPSAAMNPWLAKVPLDTPVHQMATTRPMEDLGFNHLIDELSNSLDPASGLPQHLLLDPKSLPRVSVPQAVERVHNINQWRPAQKAEADAAKANNAATVLHKEYPEKGMRWVELKAPAPKHAEGYENMSVAEREASDRASEQLERSSLADALKYEGDTMGHCVGGYCDDVLSGRSRIYSLRDAKGQPHVTVEVSPGHPRNANEWYGWQKANPEEYAKLNAEFGDDAVAKMQAATERYPVKPRIVQVKGKGNEKPIDDYLPMVQDFVRGQEWDTIDDLHNTGMFDLKGKLSGRWGSADYFTPPVLRELSRIFPTAEGPAGGAMLSHPEFGTHIKNTDALDTVLTSHPIKSRYVTEQDLVDHLTGVEPFPIEKSYRRY